MVPVTSAVARTRIPLPWDSSRGPPTGVDNCAVPVGAVLVQSAPSGASVFTREPRSALEVSGDTRAARAPPVAMSKTRSLPPVFWMVSVRVAVSPVSRSALSADLLTGETATRTLTIQNTGGSDLVFDIATGGALAALVSPLTSRADLGSLVNTEAPDGADWTSTAPTGTAQLSTPVGGPRELSQGSGILVLATADVTGTILRTLTQSQLPYDFAFTEDFTGIDFSR